MTPGAKNVCVCVLIFKGLEVGKRGEGRGGGGYIPETECGPRSRKYFLPGPLQKKFANPWIRVGQQPQRRLGTVN